MESGLSFILWEPQLVGYIIWQVILKIEDY